jgi:hypothetical protein
MDNKEFNIETETVTVIKNKKTGKVYKDEEELKVTNKGLEVFKKFMNEK